MSTWDMPCPIQAIQRDEPPGKARMPLEVRAQNMATNMGFYGKNDMNMGFFLGFSWRYGRWEAKKHDHHMGFLGISSNFMAMYGDLMRILWEFKGSMGTYGLPCGDFSMGIYWNIFCNFRVWDGPGVHMYSEILLTLW